MWPDRKNIFPIFGHLLQWKYATWTDKIPKVGSKIGRIQINPRKITKYFKHLAKAAKFRLVWSHWLWWGSDKCDDSAKNSPLKDLLTSCCIIAIDCCARKLVRNQCDQSEWCLKVFGFKYSYKRSRIWRIFLGYLKNINFQVKLSWLLFGPFLENLGYFLLQHLVTLRDNSNEK